MSPDTVVALCPYCGGEMKETRTCCSENKTTYCTECNSTGPEGPPLHFDTCEAFDAVTPCKTRPIEDALRAEIERLKDALAVALAWTSFGATPWPYGITPWATARLEDRPLMSLPGESTNSQAALRRVRAALADELDSPGGE